MRFDGNIEDLVAPSDAAERPDRNKDRLSYKQSQYQIDLTQVTQTLVLNVSILCAPSPRHVC